MAEEEADEEYESSFEDSSGDDDFASGEDSFLRGYDASSQDEYEEDEIDKAFE